MNGPTAIGESARRCPGCGSFHLHASHRRGAFEWLLASFGAQVRRCHSCRSRRAWFESDWGGSTAIRLGARPKSRGPGAIMLCAGFLACLAFLWWMITRFAEFAG